MFSLRNPTRIILLLFLSVVAAAIFQKSQPLLIEKKTPISIEPGPWLGQRGPSVTPTYTLNGVNCDSDWSVQKTKLEGFPGLSIDKVDSSILAITSNNGVQMLVSVKGEHIEEVLGLHFVSLYSGHELVLSIGDDEVKLAPLKGAMTSPSQLVIVDPINRGEISVMLVHKRVKALRIRNHPRGESLQE